MSDWITLKNTCPNCGGVKKNCAQSRVTNLIHCRAELLNSNLAHVGVSSIGFNIYADRVAQDAYKELSTQAKAEIEQKRLDREAEENARLASLLESKPDTKTLDRKIRVLLSGLSLNLNHRRDLKRRGLTDASIKRGLFKSIEYKQTFKGDLAGIPGFSKVDDGVYRYFGATGYFCFLFNQFNQIHGFQIRTDSQSPKYSWTTSYKENKEIETNYLTKDGEIPLGITVKESKIIGFSEGCLKAFVASEIHKFTMVGTGSNLHFKAPMQMKGIVSRYKSSKKFVLFPDSGALLNPSVTISNNKILDLLIELGVKPLVADYGHWFNKDAGSIDDVSKDTIIKYRSLDFYNDALKLGKYTNDATVRLPNDIKDLDYDLVYTKSESSSMSKLYGDLINLGVKVIIDTSPTGTGKTHSAANLDLYSLNQEMGIIYYAQSWNQPNNEKFYEIPRLSSRRDGTKLPDDAYIGELMTRNNCHWTERFTTARQDGIDTGGICQACPFKDLCSKSEGEGYGIKHQYSKGVVAKRLLATTQGITAKYIEQRKLPTIGVFDEWSTMPFVNKTSITTSAMGRTATMVLLNPNLLPADIADKLVAFIERLKTLANSLGTDEAYEFGYTGLDLRNHFDDAELETLLEPAAIVDQQQEKLNFEGMTRSKDIVQQNQRTNNVWLEKTIRALLGDTNLWLSGQVIEIDIKERNNDLLDLLNAHKTIIMQDATSTKKQLAMTLGIKESEIIEVKSEVEDYSNIVFKRIPINMNYRDTKDQHKQLKEIVKAIQFKNLDRTIGTIDFKKFIDRKQSIATMGQTKILKHLSDARGSNVFQAVDCVVSIGDPRRNKGEVQGDLSILFGKPCHIDSAEFNEAYNDIQCQDIIQEIGRLRANRRRDEQLSFYMISNRAIRLPHGIHFEIENANDYGVNMNQRGLDMTNHVQAALDRLARTGDNLAELTQRKLSEATGCSERTIQRIAKKLLGGWKKLKEYFVSAFVYVIDEVQTDSNLYNIDTDEKIITLIGCIKVLPKVLGNAIKKGLEDSRQYQLMATRLQYQVEKFPIILQTLAVTSGGKVNITTQQALVKIASFSDDEIDNLFDYISSIKEPTRRNLYLYLNTFCINTFLTV